MSNGYDSEFVHFGHCPTCGAHPDEPCQTPKGRRKPHTHDYRLFAIDNRPEGQRWVPDPFQGSEYLASVERMQASVGQFSRTWDFHQPA